MKTISREFQKYLIGKHCVFCFEDMEAKNSLSIEDLLAKQLFLYPFAYAAEIDCRKCNSQIGGECESALYYDPFIQQAKMAAYPISLKEKKSGWIINSKIAYHGRKPELQTIFGPSGEAIASFWPMPSEKVWRAIGKTMLCIVAVRLGNKVFNPSFDPLRNFVRFGGPHTKELGLFHGPLNRDARWQDYHIVRIEFFSDDSFIIQVDFFGRYSFSYLCKETCVGNDKKNVEVRIGALEKRWERVVVMRDGREFSNSGQIPPFYSVRVLKKFYGYA